MTITEPTIKTATARATQARKGALVNIVSRSDWGARAPKWSNNIGMALNTVFIHHTAGVMPDTTPTAEQQEMRNVQRFHMDVRGWSDIGYSWVIGPSGTIYEGRGAQKSGGHTLGYNRTSYGICFLGNMEEEKPTPAQIAGVKALLDLLVRQGYLSPRFNVLGHRDVYPTACPGDRLYALIGGFKVGETVPKALPKWLQFPGEMTLTSPPTASKLALKWERRLNKAGMKVARDGIFTSADLASLKEFQALHGLVVDGIGGPKTWAKLVELFLAR